ncbi:phosphonate C-P lyase system protein PhnH [Terrihabitans sp. B22-R8]|uniref:phosphonate C-P lyase system protein PhnH n=1 Tax=Terrihabitans sp. B22-R8 TaxID=3425128 RepID=UPI00403C9E01
MAHAFADPVFEAQAVFRAVMAALAEPGTLQELPAEVSPPEPLAAELAALALTLADHETPIWLDATLAASDEVVRYLKFYTGAPIVAEPARAMFALVQDAARCPALAAFAPGNALYPDRSTTLLIAVDRLGEDGGLVLRGPGIAGSANLRAGPLPPDFERQWRDNHALFPCGVDVVLAGPGQVVGLPRSVQIGEV